MTITCSSCGKGYDIDPKKISEMAYFNCTQCEHKIRLDQPKSNAKNPEVKQGILNYKFKAQSPYEELKRTGLSLRTKMVMLFVLVPVVFMVISNLFLLSQIKELTSSITTQSSNFLTTFGEQAVAEVATSVAEAVHLYLTSHPELSTEDLLESSEFQNLTQQDMGNTIHTLVVTKSGSGQLSRLLVPPDNELASVNVDEIMKKELPESYGQWVNIQQRAFNYNTQSSGYYTWLDKRRKYMVIAPVKNSNYFVVSTTYANEFPEHVNRLQDMSHKITNSSLTTSIIIIVATILIISLLSLFYSNNICRKLYKLTVVAERISVGELNVKIPNFKKDEIGVLAEVIRRMEYNLRIALERLRIRNL